MNRWLLLALFVAPAALYAHGLKAHVHGQARMEVVALDGQAMVSLISPAETLLGFEQAPATAEQIKAVNDLKMRFQSGTDLVWVAGEACTLTEFDSSELDAFAGKVPDKNADHADISVHWVFNCVPEAMPQGLNNHFFEALPRLEKLTVEAVNQDGQYSVDLTKAGQTLWFRSDQ